MKHLSPPPSSSLSFRGIFTDEHRVRLRQVRQGMGASFAQLGELLRINWSTIRKWEAGVSRKCHPRHVGRVAAFLNHEYDARFQRLDDHAEFLGSAIRRLPLPLNDYLEKARMIRALGRCYRQDSRRLPLFLQEALDQTAKELLEEEGRLGGAAASN